jgi:hypothetical protein
LQWPGGERLPLLRERRWSREYGEKMSVTIISRFMDGSAAMSVAELEEMWPAWSESDRMDFCQNCEWLESQNDYSDMMRYIVEHGSPTEWSGVAQGVARALPLEEAFGILRSLLPRTPTGQRGNLVQAIALTRHPDALEVLRTELAALESNPELWDDDSFMNWLAHDALCCIKYLLELGANAEQHRAIAIRLAAHPCKELVCSVHRDLSTYYDQLRSGGPP